MQNPNLNRPARVLLLLATGAIVAASFTLPQTSQASTTMGAPTSRRVKTRKLRKIPKAAIAATPTIAAADNLEVSAHNQVNAYRASKGLPAIAWNDALATQARQHSAAMANGQTAFGHDGFQERVKGSGVTYQGAAENVAYNQGYNDPVTVAVEGWLKSPGHLKNIEGNYDTAGLGVARNAQGEVYLTQIFTQSR